MRQLLTVIGVMHCAIGILVGKEHEFLSIHGIERGFMHCLNEDLALVAGLDCLAFAIATFDEIVGGQARYCLWWIVLIVEAVSNILIFN